MPDMRIRRAAPADLPVLTRLWQAAFGDPPELIERFYRRFPPAKAAWVVEDGGRVVTAAHLLEGRLHTADGNVLPCAYVYAVSTDPAHQGNGYASALMRRFAMDADVSGRVLYTLPAEASLYKWYQEIMGTPPAASGYALPGSKQPALCRMSPASARRNTLYFGRSCCRGKPTQSRQQRCWIFKPICAPCAAALWCASAADAPSWNEMATR